MGCDAKTWLGADCEQHFPQIFSRGKKSSKSGMNKMCEIVAIESQNCDKIRTLFSGEILKFESKNQQSFHNSLRSQIFIGAGQANRQHSLGVGLATPHPQ